MTDLDHTALNRIGLDHTTRRPDDPQAHADAPPERGARDAETLDADQNPVAGTLDRIGAIFEQVLTSHETQLEQLHDQIAELLAWKNEAHPDPNPETDALRSPVLARMLWEDMTAEEASQAWRRLIGWVGWAMEEFDLGAVLPPCWAHPQHRRLRRELSALMVAYTDLVVAPQATKGGEITFLAWLHAAQTRWQVYDRGDCAQRGHERASRVHTATAWPTTWLADAQAEADRDVAARAARPGRSHRPPDRPGGGEAA
jgi:hypothetical protein